MMLPLAHGLSMRPQTCMRQAAGIALAALVAASIAAGGCTKKSAAKDPAATEFQRAQALIDAGNEAYKIGDYRLAARRYAAAAVVKKDDPAAYFGMGMALSKLGRDEDARAAYSRSRELARLRAVHEFPGTMGKAHTRIDTIPPRQP